MRFDRRNDSKSSNPKIWYYEEGRHRESVRS